MKQTHNQPSPVPSTLKPYAITPQQAVTSHRVVCNIRAQSLAEASAMVAAALAALVDAP